MNNMLKVTTLSLMLGALVLGIHLAKAMKSEEIKEEREEWSGSTPEIPFSVLLQIAAAKKRVLKKQLEEEEYAAQQLLQEQTNYIEEQILGQLKTLLPNEEFPRHFQPAYDPKYEFSLSHLNSSDTETLVFQKLLNVPIPEATLATMEKAILWRREGNEYQYRISFKDLKANAVAIFEIKQ